MKHITKVIGIIAGAISSLFAMGCHKEPECIYGPPSMLDEYRKTGEIKHSGDNGDVKPEAIEIPESDGVPADIYGPPAMLLGEEEPDLPESEGVPADIYGPPEMFDEPVEEIPPEAVAEPEPEKSAADAPNQDKADEDADKKARDKDFETLKKVNSSRTKKEKKTVYGPPAKYR